ncbi:hypothetical protein [Curtanaerobium respiraculi]|uniref:hypothetical protein n=1 Tax=Curtanaerobium respiraculi TaxID=2949669 RepID=UPI0024B36DC2|nr:hypothetical protein [Curtanaerobium respiraculi]
MNWENNDIASRIPGEADFKKAGNWQSWPVEDDITYFSFRESWKPLKLAPE